MSVTRQFVKSLKPGPQKTHYNLVLKDMMANDVWAMNVFKDVGVILTSHPGNRPYLKASLKSHKKLGFWTTVVYDNYFDPNNKQITYEQRMPARDVFDMADTFLFSHYQTWGGVLYPYFWCLYLGVHTMSSFKYIFCSNGDCVLEKPEGFPKIIEMLGDADIMGCGYEHNNGRPLFNTTSFIAKSEAIKAIMVHYRDHLVGIDNYEKYTQAHGNTEGRFAVAIKELGLKMKIVPKNPVNTQVAAPGGTWYDILGFRHIHGEWNHAHRRKKIPPYPNHIDKRYMKHKVDLALKYHETEDEEEKKKLLKKWWNTR
jgi:hypothetical protein